MYADNLRFVDDGIRRVEQLINEYYQDNATAFVFTSDHGMTDWGISFKYPYFTSIYTDVIFSIWNKVHMELVTQLKLERRSWYGVREWTPKASMPNAGKTNG